MAGNSWYLFSLPVALARGKDGEKSPPWDSAGNREGVALSVGRSCVGLHRTHGSISWNTVSDDPGSHLGEQMGHSPGKAHHEGLSLSMSRSSHSSAHFRPGGALWITQMGQTRDHPFHRKRFPKAPARVPVTTGVQAQPSLTRTATSDRPAHWAPTLPANPTVPGGLPTRPRASCPHHPHSCQANTAPLKTCFGKHAPFGNCAQESNVAPSSQGFSCSLSGLAAGPAAKGKGGPGPGVSGDVCLPWPCQGFRAARQASTCVWKLNLTRACLDTWSASVCPWGLHCRPARPAQRALSVPLTSSYAGTAWLPRARDPVPGTLRGDDPRPPPMLCSCTYLSSVAARMGRSSHRREQTGKAQHL